MKTKIIIAITITVVGFMGIKLATKQDGNMATPKFSEVLNSQISSTPIPTPTIKQFKFDSATDLKKELDSINPEVLDSDFQE